MKVELLVSVGVLLYIVFFSHSPPYVIRLFLAKPVVSASVLAGIAYLTLRHNRTIGVLLLLAFLITMTRITEHYEEETPAPPVSFKPAPPIQSPTAPATPAVHSLHPIQSPTAPATPPASTKTPEPVMSCNLETFASF